MCVNDRHCFLLLALCNVYFGIAHPKVLYKNGVLKYFAKFTITPVSESLFNKVAGINLQQFQKLIPSQVFSGEFWEIFKYAIL